MSNNTIKHKYKTTKKDREALHGHRGCLIWFTGLSGSGKSTLANLTEIALNNHNLSTYTLDGDNVRNGINKDLSFSEKDRAENIRRISEISNLMIDAGLIVLAAFVSPYIKDRKKIKQVVGENNYIEIFVNTSIEECERRDVKGLYRKARLGEIKNMTGISAPYQAPTNPNIEVVTDNKSIEECVEKILNYIYKKLNFKK